MKQLNPINLNDESMDFESKSNREKSMTAKRGWFWCGKCDRQLVSQIKKCPVCGFRETPNKRKGI